MSRAPQILKRCLLCSVAILLLAEFNAWAMRVNATTAALYMLLVVLAAAARWGLTESIYTSVAGVLAFNFFFLPPVGTFTIADPENWAALGAFLVTAVTASKLSADARRRAEEALAGRAELARLYELSRALLMNETRDAIADSVVQAGRVLMVDEIAFFDATANRTYGSVDASVVRPEDLVAVSRTGTPIVNPPAAVIPVRLGAHVIGSLATVSPLLTPAVRDAVANLLAINYERAQALDRAATAEAARRNEEFKSSLLDGLAHDLKTPLTAVRTCATHLISSPPRSEEVRKELLSIIDQESQRLQGTITEAIELARMESRKLRLELQPAPLDRIIETAVSGTRDESPGRYLVECPAGLLVTVDADLIGKALLQVLENARKYSPPDSPIQIESGFEDGRVFVRVLDRGPGFDPAELSRVFEKFFRGRRTRAEGTGVGLAVARSIIEAHGGGITAQNRVDGGAELVITLPR